MWIFLNLPKWFRYRVIRGKICVHESYPNDFKIKLATTKEELTGAYQLVYESYLSKGLEVPKVAPFRVTKYNLLPTTFIIVAKKGEDVIGTITLTLRGRLGLPMEDIISIDDDIINNKIVGEINAFSIDYTWRGDHGLFLLLGKYLLELSLNVLKVDHWFIVTHPAAKDIYQALFLFRPYRKKVFQYDFVEGTRAFIQHLDLAVFRKVMKQNYQGKERKRNLYRFYFEKHYPNLELPQLELGQNFLNVINQQMINFYKEKISDLVFQLSDKEKEFIYLHYFDNEIEELLGLSWWTQRKRYRKPVREIRYDVNYYGKLEDLGSGEIYSVKIKDVSYSGVGIIGPDQKSLVKIEREGLLIIPATSSSPVEVRIEVRIIKRWQSEAGNRLGFSVSPEAAWTQYVQNLEKVFYSNLKTPL